MRRLVVALFLLACAAPPASADHLLQFESGMTLVVSAWHIEGEWLFLELPDGAGGLVVSKALLFDARDLDAPVGVIAWRRAPEPAAPLDPLAPVAPAVERARYEFARSVAERPDRRPRPVAQSAQTSDGR